MKTDKNKHLSIPVNSFSKRVELSSNQFGYHPLSYYIAQHFIAHDNSKYVSKEDILREALYPYQGPCDLTAIDQSMVYLERHGYLEKIDNQHKSFDLKNYRETGLLWELYKNIWFWVFGHRCFDRYIKESGHLRDGNYFIETNNMIGVCYRCYYIINDGYAINVKDIQPVSNWFYKDRYPMGRGIKAHVQVEDYSRNESQELLKKRMRRITHLQLWLTQKHLVSKNNLSSQNTECSLITKYLPI